jgi:hypothetical protein
VISNEPARYGQASAILRVLTRKPFGLLRGHIRCECVPMLAWGVAKYHPLLEAETGGDFHTKVLITKNPRRSGGLVGM